MLDNLRFDYARIRIATDHDIAQQRTQHLKELIDLWAQSHSSVNPGGHEFRVFPGSTPGERQYCIEIWGPLAEIVTWLDFEEWADRCMRLDVRYDLPSAKAAGITKLGYRLQNTKKKQNILLFNSKARSKQRGRNSGGVGLAVGSHKSVFRTSIYKRGSEPAAIEFQYSGSALDACVNTTTKRRTIAEVNSDPWSALRRHMRVSGLDRFERGIGMEYDHILAIISGYGEAEGVSKLEQLAFDCLTAWGQLDDLTKATIAPQMGVEVL